MKIIFAGTPDFAASSLKALIDAQFEVSLVLTQPDRPAGRGRKLKMSEVKQLALENNIPVETPMSLSLSKGGEEAVRIRKVLEEIKPDLLVVAAYGLIIPTDILNLPTGLIRKGYEPIKAVNVHGSLLPRWRGAAPIARAILEQDPKVGITIMEMDAGLDTGDMLYEEERKLNGTETALTLTQELADLGANMLVKYLKDVDQYPPRKQPEIGVTYANKLQKEEAGLVFSKTADALSAQIRAFNPFPGSTFMVKDQVVKVWGAKVSGKKTNQMAGTVLGVDSEGFLEIACGDGSVLLLTEMQRSGGKKLPAKQFLSGFTLSEGTILE